MSLLAQLLPCLLLRTPLTLLCLDPVVAGPSTRPHKRTREEVRIDDLQRVALTSDPTSSSTPTVDPRLAKRLKAQSTLASSSRSTTRTVDPRLVRLPRRNYTTVAIAHSSPPPPTAVAAPKPVIADVPVDNMQPHRVTRTSVGAVAATPSVPLRRSTRLAEVKVKVEEDLHVGVVGSVTKSKGKTKAKTATGKTKAKGAAKQ